MLSDLVGPGIMGSAGGLENENSSTIQVFRLRSLESQQILARLVNLPQKTGINFNGGHYH